jgi:hypothetical protein
MRCSSLYPTRWPRCLLRYGHVPTAALQAQIPAATGTSEARQPTAVASTAGPARDCRRSIAGATVMQVRPLPVVSGTAASSPVGRSPFGALGWL